MQCFSCSQLPLGSFLQLFFVLFSLFVFRNLTVISLGVYLSCWIVFFFLLLWLHWGSRNRGLMFSFIYFGKCSVIISSNISSARFFPFLSVYSSCSYVKWSDQSLCMYFYSLYCSLSSFSLDPFYYPVCELTSGSSLLWVFIGRIHHTSSSCLQRNLGKQSWLKMRHSPNIERNSC